MSQYVPVGNCYKCLAMIWRLENEEEIVQLYFQSCGHGSAMDSISRVWRASSFDDYSSITDCGVELTV